MGDDGSGLLERTDVLGTTRLIAGKYKLGRLLGEGGMGAVYEAEHTGLGAKVAIKLLAAHICENPTSVARFRREARAAAAVKHDNIVQVTDTGDDDDGVPFIVMEFLEGESLSGLLHRERVLPPDIAVPIIVQILSGLAAAHDSQVVHRDLKPPNIFITRASDGAYRVKILDFGISKLGAGLETRQLTADGGLVGTPQYMSPEQVRGQKDVDRRADIYAVGVLLYRLLTGRLPFSAKDHESIYQQILDGSPVAPRSLVPEISSALEEVILTAIHPERELRYRDARAMRVALYEAMPGLPRDGSILPPSVSVSPSEPPRDLPTARTFDMSSGAAQSTNPARPNVIEARASAPLPTPLAVGESRIEPAPGNARTTLLAVGMVAVIGAVIGGLWLAAAPEAVTPEPGEGPGADPTPPPALPPPTGEPIRFGLSRYLPHTKVEERHSPMARYLERRLERPVELVIVESYDDVAARVAAGDVQLAALSPYTYVRARRQSAGIYLLATPVMRGDVTSYHGYILVRADSPVTAVDDLRGRDFCYVSRTSTSGYLYPRAKLRAAGLDPDTDLGSITYAGDHVASLRALLAGDCEAAAAFANAFLEQAPEHGMSRESFRILATTAPIPLDAYVAAANVPPELAQQLAAALLALEPGSEIAREALGDEEMIGFVEVEDSAFDPVRDEAAED